MATIEQFGDYVFPNDALEEDPKLGDGRSGLLALPMADGAFDQLGDDCPRAAGQVSHRFRLTSATYGGLDTAEDDLREAMRQGRQALYWRMRDGTVRWAWAKCIGLSMPADRNTRLQKPVTVTFELAEGVRYSRYPEGPVVYGAVGLLYGSGLLWGAGETVSFAFSGVSTDITVVNNGNAPALAAVTVACGGGQSAQNVKVARRVGGVDAQYFQATRTIAANKSLVVDCADLSVKYDGSDDYANFSIGATQVEWLHLEPGNNTIRVTCANAGDAGTISFAYYATFE